MKSLLQYYLKHFSNYINIERLEIDLYGMRFKGTPERYLQIRERVEDPRAFNYYKFPEITTPFVIVLN